MAARQKVDRIKVSTRKNAEESTQASVNTKQKQNNGKLRRTLLWTETNCAGRSAQLVASGNARQMMPHWWQHVQKDGDSNRVSNRVRITRGKLETNLVKFANQKELGRG